MIVALSIAACAPRGAGFGTTPAHLVDATAPVAWEAVGNTAPAPATGWIRAIDDFGQTVPSDPITVAIDGATVTATFDGLGYADVIAPLRGHSALVEGAGAPAWVHALPETWLGPGLDPATVPGVTAPGHAVAVDDAVLVAEGAQVWWVPVSGTAAHVVLRADGDLVGLRARHVDVDGAVDAIAWTATNVYLLRARIAGGFARGAAFRADGLDCGGADIGDLDGDKLPDIAIGWSDGATHVLDVWSGDGEWGFAAQAPRNLEAAPADLLIGDNTGEGTAQITVLLSTGDWSRFLQARPGLYMQVGPSTPKALKLSGEGSLLSQGDMTGDGAAEIYAFDPWIPGLDRRASVMQVDRDVLVLESVGHPGAQPALTDANLDGQEDLLLLAEDGVLSAIWFDTQATDGGIFHTLDVEQVAEGGPIAAGHWLADDLSPDLFVAGPSLWTWRRGQPEPTPDQPFWHTDMPPFTAYGAALQGPMAVLELAGTAASVEVLTFAAGADGTRLAVTSFTPRAPGINLGSVVVGPEGGAVTDFDICGEIAWVIADNTLSRVDLSEGTPSLTADNSTAAQRIACGALGGNAEAVLLVDDEYVTVSANAVAIGDRLPAGGAQDVAIADLGDGPRAHSCIEAGCRITDWALPWGTVLATSTLTTTTIQSLDSTQTFSGGGTPQVTDADGDGDDDLLVVRPEPSGVRTVVQLFVANAEAISEGLVWSVPTVLADYGGMGDGDGDGSADFWSVDLSGTLVRTESPAPPEPEDTGAATP